ncbi:pentapeptide repeat-containing protein [Legionella dresdenensis]|uniref:Pentapeptide repeat-containing protein n=1 Tax=Legionella dresdenensis TaxID=450200 RepID=A0ABV8CC89_9GAMM
MAEQVKDLRETIDNQDIKQLEKFLKENPLFDLNHITANGLSALWWAITPNDDQPLSKAIIACLLESGRINPAQPYCGFTPFAALQSQDNTADILIMLQDCLYRQATQPAPFSGQPAADNVTLPSLQEWEISDQVFINSDLRGTDLATVDLSNVTFKQCDLRLTGIELNPTITADHIRTNKIDEKFLKIAITLRNLAAVKAALAKGSLTTNPLWESKGCHPTLLHQAIWHWENDLDTEIIREILASSWCVPDILTENNEFSGNVLELACARNNLAVVKLLLKNPGCAEKCLGSIDPKHYAVSDELKKELIKAIAQIRKYR